MFSTCTQRLMQLSAIGLISIHFSIAQAGQAMKALVTLPELGVLVREIGGPEITVETLMRAGDDPHFQDATPAMVAKAVGADLLCQVGLELEAGWLAAVVRKSANSRISPNGSGDCVAARTVKVIDRSESTVDRSMGHVHLGGNPHFYLSLRSLAETTHEIEARLLALRPNDAKEISERAEALRNRLGRESDSLNAAWSGVPADRKRVVQYHKEFDYLLMDRGLRVVGLIEELPGRPPAAGQLARISQLTKDQSIRLVIAGASASQRHLSRFEELSGLRVTRLPGFLPPAEMTLEGLLAFHARINRALLEAIKAQ